MCNCNVPALPGWLALVYDRILLPLASCCIISVAAQQAIRSTGMLQVVSISTIVLFLCTLMRLAVEAELQDFALKQELLRLRQKE